METKSFAVILPAYNEEGNIGSVLDALQACAQGGAIIDIVVVDDLSTDSTVAIARARGVRVMKNRSGQRLTIAKLRNMGTRSTSAPLIAFLDSDMLVPADWLEKAAEHFNSGFNGALGFAVQVPASASWVGRAWGNRSNAPPSEIVTDFLPGCNILITRAAFDSVGGFDEMLVTGEDKDFTYRLRKAGYPVLRSPATTVTHLGSERSLGEFVRKEFWRQSSTLAFAKRHSFAPRTLRNPMLSLWHLCCIAFLIAATAFQVWPAATAAAALWLVPAALLTLRGATNMRNKRDLPLVFILTFLRWNVSGLALVWQAVKYGVLWPARRKPQ